MTSNNSKAARGKNKRSGNAPKLTAEDERAILAKQLRIKPKTKAMVDRLLENPKLSQTQAYIDTHMTINRKAASVEAAKTLAKPSVLIYKEAAIGKAKRRIVSLVDSESENIALKASQDILDRTQGKAKQLDDIHTKTVRVEIDLTGVKMGNHYISPSS